MIDQRTSLITGAGRERGNVANCERRQRMGDSAQKRAARRSGDPAERDALAGVVLEGLGLFGGQRGR